MVDVFEPQKRSEVMSRIRSSGNKETELAMLRILRENGISGWRRNLPLVGKPDFTFKKERLVLFVDGCFWHGCPNCYKRPHSKRKYWDAKLERNKRRDRMVAKCLRRLGWRVVRVWYHQLKNEQRIANHIRNLLAQPHKLS